jgi:Holliday junction resolvasome RuvABC endonuclease subunit
MSNIISIDFSLNSAAICINNNEDYKFISIVNTNSFIGKKGNVLSEYKVHSELEKLNIVEFIKNKRLKQDKNYKTDQKNKMKDAIKISSFILDLISANSIVAMEGFSYSSKSRSFIDLILFASIVRAEIYKKAKELIIISPSELKKFFTGKGNAGKVQMLRAFEKETLDHDLSIYVKDNDLIKGEKDVVKPIDDLVDAFAIQKYLKENMKK